jgi:hypothetical protein
MHNWVETNFDRIVLSVVLIAIDEMTRSECVQAEFGYSSKAAGCQIIVVCGRGRKM